MVAFSLLQQAGRETGGGHRLIAALFYAWDNSLYNVGGNQSREGAWTRDLWSHFFMQLVGVHSGFEGSPSEILVGPSPFTSRSVGGSSIRGISLSWSCKGACPHDFIGRTSQYLSDIPVAESWGRSHSLGYGGRTVGPSCTLQEASPGSRTMVRE